MVTFKRDHNEHSGDTYVSIFLDNELIMTTLYCGETEQQLADEASQFLAKNEFLFKKAKAL